MKKQLFFIILLGVVELLAGCRPEGKETETGKSTACRIGFSRRSPQSETTESEWTTGFDPDFE